MEPRKRILVVEDEVNFRELLRYLLDSAGYALQTAADGLEGLRVFYSWQPDLVLLDIVMPAMDGREMLGRIREMADTPVIMLTALGSEDQKVRALRAGADDYLVKPFGNDELLARVEAVLRRAGRIVGANDTYTDHAIWVDFEHHRVFVRGTSVELSPTEFRLLTALVRNADVVLSAEKLAGLVWRERPAGPGNVRVYVNYLRKKLERNPGRPQLIETVRGFGYRYQPPLSTS